MPENVPASGLAGLWRHTAHRLRLRLTHGLGRLCARAQAHGAHALARTAQRMAAAIDAPAIRPDFHLLMANLGLGSPTHSLDALNACLAAQGLPPVRLIHADRPAGVTNLCGGPAPQPASPMHAPLVSVIMTCWQSASLLEHAIGSVLAQSWSNLELIVVDDASTDDTWPRLQALALTDARLRCVRLPANVGTYVAKLVGLKLARGEFVTCHDSDDWSHPLKLERQVWPLMQSASLMASVSCWVRIDAQGRFHARQRWPLVRLNPSSLMFRREPVLSSIGAWDPVRTGADTEFLERIKAVFGPRSVHRVPQALSYGSHRPGSLMNHADTGFQGRPALHRKAYAQAWQQWHRACARRRVVPRITHDLGEALQPRAFAVPNALVPAPDRVARAWQCVPMPATHGPRQSGLQGPWAVNSAALKNIPTLASLMNGPVLNIRQAPPGLPVKAMLAWGRKPSARAAEARARAWGLPLLRLEDGFIRSFGTGRTHPPLSLVVDDLGIHYDSTRPSRLEVLLQTHDHLLDGLHEQVRLGRELITAHGLSKYNHAPSLRLHEARRGQALLRADDTRRVLVVDQTAGDLSIELAGADAGTFEAMLAAALREHPEATVYVKTHPEVSAGHKGGHLSPARLGPQPSRVVFITEPIEPASLMRHMDHVHVVSSSMGFEALLLGVPVSCHGLPWYAGWGLTRDHLSCPRRTRSRTLDELFAAAFLHYTRWLDPLTHRPGQMLDVLNWLAEQRRMAGLLEPQA